MYEAKVMGFTITQIIDKLNFSWVHNGTVQSVLLSLKTSLLDLTLCFQTDAFWKIHYSSNDVSLLS